MSNSQKNLFTDGSEVEHIFARRNGYTHHGIYIGDGRVIHFTGEVFSKSNALVRETDIKEFANGDKVYRVIYKKCLTAEESLHRARWLLGHSGYSLVKNNCEHFATWCKTGKKRSKQVKAVKNQSILILVSLAAVAIPVVGPHLFTLHGFNIIKNFKDYAYIANVELFCN